ncbi:MAG: hypothetical protein Q9196_004733 [Gyalolechia fulgens]
MPPKTRAQIRKDEDQAGQGRRQEEQQPNQPGSQPQGQGVKKQAKPRPKAQATKQRKNPRGKKPKGNQPPHPPTSLQLVRSGIRKKSVPQRQPRFDVPYWKVRAGVPTLVLRLLASGTETDAADDDQNELEDMEMDSESGEDIPSGHDERDAPQTDPPSSPKDVTPRPSPPPVRQPGDRVDCPIRVDSQARTPPPHVFPKYPEDDSEDDVWPLTLPITGSARDEEVEKWGSRMARFIRSPASHIDAEAWYGIKPLGKGSFGMAGLWQKKNIDGEVIDQQVVKQIGKQHGTPWEAEKPIEVQCMQMLNDNSTAGESVVEFRDYRRYPRREVHRIYMEYCPYGDLGKLIKEYRARKQFIPEKFIWEAFYYLARACKGLDDLILEHERTPQATVAVHRDIKPCNVFLGEQPANWNAGWNPAYPMVKLGDFGTVVFTGPKDKDNPREQEILPADKAWEYDERALNRLRHYQKHESRGGRPLQLLSHTNVWGIGATIFELMSLKEVFYYLYDYVDGSEDGSGDGEGETYLEGVTKDALCDVDLAFHYPERLINIMKMCLRPNPATRPSVDQLLWEIQEARSAWVGLDNEENLAEKDRIPFGNFESLEEGEWQPDPNQHYSSSTGDRFSRSSLKAKVERNTGENRHLPDNQKEQEDQQEDQTEDEGWADDG